MSVCVCVNERVGEREGEHGSEYVIQLSFSPLLHRCFSDEFPSSLVLCRVFCYPFLLLFYLTIFYLHLFYYLVSSNFLVFFSFDFFLNNSKRVQDLKLNSTARTEHTHHKDKGRGKGRGVYSNNSCSSSLSYSLSSCHSLLSVVTNNNRYVSNMLVRIYRVCIETYTAYVHMLTFTQALFNVCHILAIIDTFRLFIPFGLYSVHIRSILCTRANPL